MFDIKDKKYKSGFGAILTYIASVLSFAGIVMMIVASSISKAYAFYSLTLMLILAVAGMLLVVLASYLPLKKGNFDLYSTLSILIAIVLFMMDIRYMINERILLISGLFTYNAGSTIGWKIFYATIASIACFLLSIFSLIVASFTRAVKEDKLKVH
ncbi:MAG TPA: hypothetical protein GXX49_09130 [Clostridiaceae bacterium]|jgi:hypothetical protein|nr:hypothetical protein [Clostridiaceae bacterium]